MFFIKSGLWIARYSFADLKGVTQIFCKAFLELDLTCDLDILFSFYEPSAELIVFTSDLIAVDRD